MNKKIEKFMEEWKSREDEIFDSVLNPFIDRLEAGEVVAHNEIQATLTKKMLCASEKQIEEALQELADKRKILFVKEKGFYVLADDNDIKIYVNNEQHDMLMVLGVFGILSLGAVIVVLSWITPNSEKLLSCLLMIWFGLFIFTVFHAFSRKEKSFFGSNYEKL